MYFLLLFWSVSQVAGSFEDFFDRNLLRSYINSSECMKQIDFLWKNAAGMKFFDSSGKFPSGIAYGNTHSLGEYQQCIDIYEVANGMMIEGKYCRLSLPLNSPFSLHNLSSLVKDHWNEQIKKLENKYELYKLIDVIRRQNEPFFRRVSDIASDMIRPYFSLGVCVPKVCDVTEAIDYVQYKIGSIIELNYGEEFCRIKGDGRIHSLANYVALILLSVLLALTLLGSCYDRFFSFDQDYSLKSSLLKSFSIYTNCTRVLRAPCVNRLSVADGLRTMSMLWIALGHTYSMVLSSPVHNIHYAISWITRWSAVLVNASPLAVDTFLMLSGIFCVYTTLPRYSKLQFTRGLPLFYLSRLVRVWPVLGAVLAAQSSILAYGASGPQSQNAAVEAAACRKHWLAALMHVQNFLDPSQACLLHSWYVSVDTQLYICSPLVLISLFGTKQRAVYALSRAIVLSIATTAFISFQFNLMPTYFQFTRFKEDSTYQTYYYQNTVVRSPPFFIGMAYGYILHLHRDKIIRFSKLTVCVLWFLCVGVLMACLVLSVVVVQWDHQNQTIDNWVNSFMRPAWAAVVGWALLACENGCGGSLAWLLSHPVWRIPARVSYAFYLCHFPIIQLMLSTRPTPLYFSALDLVYRYFADVALSFTVALLLTIFVEEPVFNIYKLIINSRDTQHIPRRKPSRAVIIIKAEHQV